MSKVLCEKYDSLYQNKKKQIKRISTYLLPRGPLNFSNIKMNEITPELVIFT